MSTNIIVAGLVGVSLTCGCSRPSFPDDPSGDSLAGPSEIARPASVAPATAATAGDIKDVPAIDQQRYPDSIGYLYQGSLATIFWLQNEPWVTRADDLTQYVGRLMQRGIAGEILTSNIQQVDAPPHGEPTLQDMATAAVQSVQAMAQYTFVTSDYVAALGGALKEYNTDPARQQAVADSASRVDSKLRAIAAASPPGSLPAPPPPANQQLLRPGKYLADAVKDHARERLLGSANRLQHAIETRNVTAYAIAFGEVFFRTEDAELARTALEVLSVHHLHGILRGQPLDTVVAQYVASKDPDRPFTVDQLSLINQVNLSANDESKPRRALVAALLLLDEDHRQAEADPTLSSAAIWDHVEDAPWLVSQLVRVKADGTTAAHIEAVIDGIVASL